MNNDITVNAWLDTHMECMKGRKLRIISTTTWKGVGDMYILYMDRKVKAVKITTRYVFLFI